MKLLKKRKEKRAAKKAAIDAAPGTSRLEKRLNVAGAKARAKKAQRQKVKEFKKASKTKLSDKQASEFEKFAGVKSTVVAKKPKPGDRIVSSKPKAKVVQPEKKELAKADRTAGMTFNQAFAAARKAGQKRFEWRGESYNTKLAKHGASLAIMVAPVKAVKKGSKAQNGGKVTDPKKQAEQDKSRFIKNINDEFNQPKKKIKISTPEIEKMKKEYSSLMENSRRSNFTKEQQEVFKSRGITLDKKIQEKIKATPEYKKMMEKRRGAMYGGAIKKAMYGAKLKKK